MSLDTIGRKMMNKVDLPLKIVFIIFAVSLIISAISFNLGKEKVFYITLIIVIVSAILMVILHKK